MNEMREYIYIYYYYYYYYRVTTGIKWTVCDQSVYREWSRMY